MGSSGSRGIAVGTFIAERPYRDPTWLTSSSEALQAAPALVGGVRGPAPYGCPFPASPEALEADPARNGPLPLRPDGPRALESPLTRRARQGAHRPRVLVAAISATKKWLYAWSRVRRPICAELHGSGEGAGLIISVCFGF